MIVEMEISWHKHYLVMGLDHFAMWFILDIIFNVDRSHLKRKKYAIFSFLTRLSV